jgi:hypothetical protein
LMELGLSSTLRGIAIPCKHQNTDSKSAEGNLMGVRFPLPAPI